MKSKTIAGLIAIVAIVALGTVPTLAAEPTLPPGYTWYEDEEFKFKIGYPEGFEKGEGVYGEGILGGVFFNEPDTPNIIAVTILDSECNIEELKAMGAKEVVINGREGYDVIFQPIPIVKQRLVYFPVDERCYSISCSTAAELFDEYAAKFDIAINSFVIEAPAPSTPSPSPTATPTSVPVAEAPEEPGFEMLLAIAGLLAVAYLLRRRK
jgi:PGF-CTERM protein